jgi:hypothetical protein
MPKGGSAWRCNPQLHLGHTSRGDPLAFRSLELQRWLWVPMRQAGREGKAHRRLNGFSCLYHNSAVSLVHDGELLAAAEEGRFTRLKNDRRFPHQAANYCPEQGGIDPRDLDAVVHYDNAAQRTFNLAPQRAKARDSLGDGMCCSPALLLDADKERGVTERENGLFQQRRALGHFQQSLPPREKVVEIN